MYESIQYDSTQDESAILHDGQMPTEIHSLQPTIAAVSAGEAMESHQPPVPEQTTDSEEHIDIAQINSGVWKIVGDSV